MDNARGLVRTCAADYDRPTGSGKELRSSIPNAALVPGVMLGFGYLIMKRTVFDLVDGVFDTGDNALLVVSGSRKEQIPFSDIKNVSYTAYAKTPRVTLLLRRPSVFGTRISFLPPLRFIPFSASPIIDDLIERIDVARRA